MMNRREWLRLTAAAAAGAALTVNPRLLEALKSQSIMTRAIPSTGEHVPVIGLGSSATFSQVARSEDYSALREVLSVMLENGGTVFDTAPSYGASEEVSGRIVNDLGAQDRIFWATKVNVAQQGAADPERARAQLAASFDRIRKDPIDCIQVHNLGDIPTQLGILKEMKEDGRIRYIGTTVTNENRYPELAAVMRNEPLDFIGVDYAVDNRSAEELIFPLAQERGIAVMVYVPFGRTRLWNRVSGRDVPAFAHEFGAHSWAQFFLKFCLSHPAVTCVTPATSNPRNMLDNLGGGVGAIPDEATRRRMVEVVDALPMPS